MKISLALGTLLLATISLFAQTSCGTVTDIEENTYKTVQIGSQCWMAENLKTKHYADGRTINKGLRYAEGEIGNINESSNIVFWYYPNGDVSLMSDYGLLYNWAAVMDGASSSNRNPSGVQGICPTGWHVPSVAEWNELENYVSRQKQHLCERNSKHIAKSLASTTKWKTCTDNCAPGNNLSTNNSTGFNAVPAGSVIKDYYSNVTTATFFWTTQKNEDAVCVKFLLNYDPNLLESWGNQHTGHSVRCVRNKPIDNAARTGEGQNEKQNNNSSSDNTLRNTVSYENAKQNNQKTTSSTPTEISSCGTVKDYDGNTYNTVQIGGQCWMAEELRAETYSDGSRVSYSNPDGLSGPYTEKWFCYYKNGHSKNKLYYWGAAVNYKEPNGRRSKQSKSSTKSTGNNMATSVQGLCPSGWHIPSQAEWEQLRRYLKDNDPSGNYATRLAMIEGEYYWTSELESEESYPLGFKYQKSNEWSFQEYKRNLFVRCVHD